MIPFTSLAHESARRIRWREMRCARCRHLLQKVEEEALRPGKRLEIKCGRCKMINYLVGENPGCLTARVREPTTRIP
jgi:phage FluMu protein Com